jgi:hypothetical protein
MPETPYGSDFEDYEEEVAQVAPTVASIGRDNGTASITYLCKHDEIPGKIRDVMEYTHIDERYGGGLRRNIPLACPLPGLEHLYALRISPIRGFGIADKEFSEGAWLEAPGPVYYATYEGMKYSVEFSTRPYAVLPDSSIETDQIEWYDVNNEKYTTPCAEEFRRFVIIKKGDTSVELITQQNGQMKLRLSANNPSKDLQLTAMPSMVVPKSSLVVRHIGIPAWWVQDSGNNYDLCVGKVNQKEIFGYRPGTLLLMSMSSSEPYPSPVAKSSYDNVTRKVTVERFVDVTLNFAVTNRSPVVMIYPENKNHIADGWNTGPSHVDRRFYYITTTIRESTSGAFVFANTNTTDNDVGATLGTPPYKSIPFQFLFRSPLRGVYEPLMFLSSIG